MNASIAYFLPGPSLGRVIAPKFEALSKEYPSINFVKIDIDELPDAAGQFGIRSVPTFMFYEGANMKAHVSSLPHQADRLSRVSPSPLLPTYFSIFYTLYVPTLF